MKLDKNYKVRVTPEQSRKIQGLLFDCGFQWAMTGQTIHPDREIILIEPDKLRLLNGAKSTLKFYIEIAADDLIALLTDLSKSAENPLQGAELTPKFKVGDGVYLLPDPRILYVNSIFSEMLTLEDGEGEFVCGVEMPNAVCRATPENYERLQATFTDIEFEQPPKELTGSDLARALIKKGWVGFNCLCGNSGDENAITETIVTGVNNSGQFTAIDGRLFNNAIPVIAWRPLQAREVGL